MSSRFAPSSRSAVLAMALTVLAFLACQPASAQKPATASTSAIAVTEVVTVTVSGSDAGWTIDVNPRVSFVRIGGTLVFDVKGLPSGYSLEIDYRAEGNTKGPFRQKDKNEPRGRLTFNAPGTADLRYDDDLVDTMVWKYDVALRDGGKLDKKVIDPMTVGKGNN